MRGKKMERLSSGPKTFQIAEEWKIKNYDTDPLIESWSKKIKNKSKIC